MNDRDNQNQDPATPEKLRAALSRLNTRPIAVPSKVDDAVLRAAREHLAGARTAESASHSADGAFVVPPSGGSQEPRKRGIPNWVNELRAGLLETLAARRWAAWGGVAVTMIAVGALVWLGGYPRLAARPEDLTGDGVVDMLDAFALARELQRAPASHPQLDLNRDGAVDERDVQALAARAVLLEQGGRS
jgi:hypothetical protein